MSRASFQVFSTIGVSHSDWKPATSRGVGPKISVCAEKIGMGAHLFDAHPCRASGPTWARISAMVALSRSS